MLMWVQGASEFCVCYFLVLTIRPPNTAALAVLGGFTFHFVKTAVSVCLLLIFNFVQTFLSAEHYLFKQFSQNKIIIFKLPSR